jgi:hypothetical protein
VTLSEEPENMVAHPERSMQVVATSKDFLISAISLLVGVNWRQFANRAILSIP